MRLCCQELMASWGLLPCWRAKHLNASEMSSVLSPGWEVIPAPSHYFQMCLREDTALQHQKEKKTVRSTNVVFRWLWALPTLAPSPLIPPTPKLVFTCHNHSYSSFHRSHGVFLSFHLPPPCFLSSSTHSTHSCSTSGLRKG